MHLNSCDGLKILFPAPTWSKCYLMPPVSFVLSRSFTKVAIEQVTILRIPK